MSLGRRQDVDEMLIRPMTDADAGEVSALILRSYDRVLVHYHSPELIERFREHATPERDPEITWLLLIPDAKG